MSCEHCIVSKPFVVADEDIGGLDVRMGGSIARVRAATQREAPNRTNRTNRKDRFRRSLPLSLLAMLAFPMLSRVV